MVRLNRCFGRNVFWSMLLFAIISFTLISGTAFCEEVGEIVLTQAETDYAQAETLRKSKKFEEAKVLFQFVFQSGSDSSLAIKGLTGVGRCEIQLGDTAAAEQLIEMLKSDYAQHADLCARLYDLSYEYWYKQDFARSESLCQYILQTFPNNTLAIRAQRGIARCLIRQGKMALAEQAADTLLIDYAEHKDLCGELDALSLEFWWHGNFKKSKVLWNYVAANTSDSKQAMKSTSKVVQCDIIEGNYIQVQQAIDALKIDYSQEKTLSYELCAIADKFYKYKQYDKAKPLYQIAQQNIADSGRLFNCRKQIIECEIKLGNDVAADQMINAFIEKYPTHPDSYKTISWFVKRYSDSKKFAIARQLCLYLAQISPENGMAFKDQLQVLQLDIRLGNHSAADQRVNSLMTDNLDNVDRSAKIAPSAHLLADYYFKTKKLDRAMELYQYALDSKPDARDAFDCQVLVIRCAMELDEYSVADQAIASFIAAHSKNPRFDERFYNIADKLWRNGKIDKAIELYQYLTQKCSDNKIVFNSQKMVAVLAIGANKKTVADQAIETLITRFADHPQFCQEIHKLAMKFWHAHRYANARELYYYVSSNISDKEEALTNFKWAMKCELKLKNQTALDQALETLDSEKSPEEFLKRVQAICGVYIDSNDPAPALPYINQALASTENLKIALEMLKLKAKCYVDMGAEDQAKVVEEEIALYSAEKDYPSVQRAIADRYRKKDELEKAMDIYNRIIADDPNTTVAMASQAGIALIHFKNKEDDKVIEAYDKLVNNYKGVPQYSHYTYIVPEEYYHLAMNSMAKGDRDKGRAYYTIANKMRNKIDVKDLTKHHAEAVIYFSGLTACRIQDVSTGIDHFKKLLNDYPESDHAGFARYYIALFASRLRADPARYQEADELIEKYFTEFINMHPDKESHYKASLRQLGDFYYHKEQYTQALDCYEKLIEKYPNQLGRVVDAMPACYEQLGYPETAKQIREIYNQSLN